MLIYLVRHGSDDDKYRGGWSELGLTEEGIEQSKQLGKYLSKNRQKYQIDTLISSDLRRTIETVSEIEIKLNISAVLSPEWRETNNGDLAGMLNSEALIKYPGLFLTLYKWISSILEEKVLWSFIKESKLLFTSLVLKLLMVKLVQML